MAYPQKPTILAVDDTPGNLLALEAVLGDEYNVVRAQSGMEAISQLQTRYDVDVILMDVHMPRMDGFETAEHIKRLRHYRDVPIVFITAVYRRTSTSSEDTRLAESTTLANRLILKY